MTGVVLILRVVCEERCWRATVTDARSRQQRHFASPEALIGFLKALLVAGEGLELTDDGEDAIT
jgi:hypothetical protein